MRLIIPVLLCCFLGNGVMAQKKSQGELLDNSLLLKFGPLALFNFDGGPELYLEYLMPKKNLGLQLGLRPILYNPWSGLGDGGIQSVPFGTISSSQPLGFDIRPEFRYYLNGFRPGIARVYLAMDVFYQKVETNRLQEFRMNTGTTTFTQQAEYTDVKKVYGFSFKSGLLWPLKDKPITFEFSYGIGLRFRNFSYENIPDGAPEPRRSTDWLNGDIETNNNNVVPAFPLSVRMVFNLTHKKNRRAMED